MLEYRPVLSDETAPELLDPELPEAELPGSELPESELPDSELLELTTAQQGVRYGQLVDPDSPKYNIGECMEIRGGLDEELFAEVVDRVVHQCDSLNTVLVERDGAVRQRVVRSGVPRARLLRVDLSGAADPAAAAERYMAGDMATVDDVEAPTHHWALLRLGPELHYWYVRYHHIAVDGLSGAVFARAVAELYTRAAAGVEPVALPGPLGGPLRALVEEEAAYRASERYAADRAYWVGRFADRAVDGSGAGAGSLLRRRTDGGGADRSGGGGKDAGAPGTGGALHTGETLPLPVFEGLRRLAAEHRTTWSAVLVAALAAYAARVAGRREVCLGLASHGRPGGLREAVGMTATVLPLPLAVEPGATVGGLVRAVAAEMRGALRHRRFSREQLARELNLSDGGSRLTDLVVNVMGYDYDLDFAGSRATSRLLSIGPLNDVSLFVSERAEGTGPLIGFDTDPALYRPRTCGCTSGRCPVSWPRSPGRPRTLRWTACRWWTRPGPGSWSSRAGAGRCRGGRRTARRRTAWRRRSRPGPRPRRTRRRWWTASGCCPTPNWAGCRPGWPGR
uniref:condensation domain-containing protein n=1 Tax=Kitasatospora fiedleri TaxID=2991545 RepID=UPI00249A978B|nr:condensation domain-containing protein [Kitasatospora fiedleri]